ncbi:MAG TPA: bifunctional 5,10-methylenetetrahydrofolate dehydrogenase/5,10-methenyltetrahydrofolate cyclohydrolase [Candidatus Nanoarchaeia archaeon]|nr:bifunctional 5,10-methylenetetrahydrofolate dehydrogenase/5,10-methenyltetrahydrofolate cyclohydrolase [Candidatus Nanoarchaeia archaeon]
MIIIDGKKIADKIKDEIVAEILLCNHNDLCAPKRPMLAIILVGERPDSRLYVSLKEKEAKKVGVDTTLYKLPANAPEKELEEMIKFLNADAATDGILLQLPLPDNFNADKIVALMNPAKDIDRFQPENLKKLMAGDEELLPPVCQVILEVLEEIKFNPEGKSACLVANSEIFGLSLAKILELHGALTKIVTPLDEDLAEQTVKADILVTAVGQPGLITGEMVKKDAVIIDIGISKEDNKVRGDVNAESVKDRAGYLTPVPGGVGPITIAAALKNTVEIWKNKK